jgi:hypothetical protein
MMVPWDLHTAVPPLIGVAVGGGIDVDPIEAAMAGLVCDASSSQFCAFHQLILNLYRPANPVCMLESHSKTPHSVVGAPMPDYWRMAPALEWMQSEQVISTH